MKEITERLLGQYERYYTINRETPVPPFTAEAEFSVHGEQYFLIKAAKWAEMDSKEFIFFAEAERLTDALLSELDEKAWNTGLARVRAKENHRNTDITLIIVAETIDGDVKKRIRKLRHYRSYRFGLWGWSGYKLGAYEQSGGNVVSNTLGRPLEKLFA